MQERTPLLLDFFPRDSFYRARLNLMQTANDFFLPGSVGIVVNRRVQTRDQIPGNLGPLVIGERQCLPRQFMGFTCHMEIISPNATPYTPTACLLGFADSSCLNTYCRIPPFA